MLGEDVLGGEAMSAGEQMGVAEDVVGHGSVEPLAEEGLITTTDGLADLGGRDGINPQAGVAETLGDAIRTVDGDGGLWK